MRESMLVQAYREHEWELLRFLARRLGSMHLASDIAHDLYVKLLGAADHPDIRDRRAYLFSMAANLATDHLRVEGRRREILAEALVQLGRFSALAADSANQTKDALVAELKALGPTLESLANAGPALTRGLSFLTTYPFPKETITNWMRGDYANLTLVVDLTLSRVDQGLFTGTRFEGDLTELEMQWGRTIGQLPSPYTGVNPLLAPYRWDQGR